MVRCTNSPYTLEDLYRLSSDEHKYELSRGHLIAEPPPGARHGRVASRIAHLLEVWVSESGRGVVLTCDTWFVLARGPDTVRGPDVAFVSRDRYCALADETRPVPGAPDLAIEVLSPSNRRRDVDAKIADYLNHGTLSIWVIDPDVREVKVYRQNGEPVALSEAGRLTDTDLLPGFDVAVADVFRTFL